MKIHLRILSLGMALTVTFSSVGVAISKHLCGGEVRDIAFFHNADSCEHKSEARVIKCTTHEDMVIQLDSNLDDCCTDTNEVLKDDNPKYVMATDISISPHFFILFTCSLFITHLNNFSHNADSQYGDSTIPPLLNQVRYILVNVFRL